MLLLTQYCSGKHLHVLPAPFSAAAMQTAAPAAQLRTVVKPIRAVSARMFFENHCWDLLEYPDFQMHKGF